MSRPDLRALGCPNCGARIDAESTGGRITCRYCGQAFELPPEAPPPRIVVVAPGVARPPPGMTARTIASALVVLVAGAVLIAARWGPFLSQAIPSQIRLPSPIPTALSTFMWDTVGGPPIPAAVGAGTVEGFVGRVRMRGDDTLWIVAFEGSKLGVVWKAGPLGTYSDGYAATFMSVVGHDVVVTDHRASVHVYDLGSGREVRTVKLTDRAKSMCAATDGKSHVWIEAKDEKNVVFDADLGTASPAPRPAWCPVFSGASDCRGWLTRGPPRPGCKEATLAPRVSGFEPNNVLEEGDAAIALGRKHPGTGLPMAVGFDPKTRTLRWQQPVASGDQASVAESSAISVMDALVAGRFVAPYEITSKGWHFTAFDAKTGQRLWDVPLQPNIGVDQPDGFNLSAARMYVMRTSSVEVYDAKTGAFVGTVGSL